MAKTRIAPLKQITIPRLELMACCLGARLAKTIKDAMEWKNASTYYWTDSSTVLYCIKEYRSVGWMLLLVLDGSSLLRPLGEIATRYVVDWLNTSHEKNARWLASHHFESKDIHFCIYDGVADIEEVRCLGGCFVGVAGDIFTVRCGLNIEKISPDVTFDSEIIKGKQFCSRFGEGRKRLRKKFGDVIRSYCFLFSQHSNGSEKESVAHMYRQNSPVVLTGLCSFRKVVYHIERDLLSTLDVCYPAIGEVNRLRKIENELMIAFHHNDYVNRHRGSKKKKEEGKTSLFYYVIGSKRDESHFLKTHLDKYLIVLLLEGVKIVFTMEDSAEVDGNRRNNSNECLLFEKLNSVMIYLECQDMDVEQESLVLWRDDDLLYLAIEERDGLNSDGGKRVDLFYLTNQCNLDRLDEVKGVVRRSMCSSLWIGETSEYMDFRWRDYSFLVSIINSWGKYVFYGLNLYLLVGDVILKMIREGGLKSSKLNKLLQGIRYKGRISEKCVARFLHTAIYVEWMNSFIFVVDHDLLREDKEVLYNYNVTKFRHNN